ncbi:MAG: hypothetical protein NT080_07740 [Spirochaetes bacterium]|nr:hypothetical protein [Spirochaetota bacterium]
MKKTLVFLAAALVATSMAFAQAAPKKVLTDADIKKFVKDMPVMSPELDAVEIDYAPGDEGKTMSIGDMRTMFDKLKIDARVKKILAKYGWNEAFFEKFFVITVGYSAIMIEQGVKDVYAELDASTDYSSADKETMKSQMGPMLKQMTDMAAEYRKAVHADDMKLLERNKADLDRVFESGK